MGGGRAGSVVVLAMIALVAGVAEAQRPQRPVQIGALTESWGPTPAIVALRDGLQALGYREDRDFTLGVRFTQGDSAELQAAARDLVRQGADIIVTTEGANTAKAAQAATDRIPIVFIGGDPVELGLVQSLARPGGNLTGIASLDVELAPKRLEVFRDLVPRLKRVLLVYDGTNARAATALEAYRAAARHLGLILVERPVRTQDEAATALSGARRSDVDGILAPRPISLNIPGFVVDAGKGLPTMFAAAFFVERGGLASYGATDADLGRQAARFVDRILKGAKPSDLPVEQPTKFELVINLKTARALGLTIPAPLLRRADRIID